MYAFRPLGISSGLLCLNKYLLIFGFYLMRKLNIQAFLVASGLSLSMISLATANSEQANDQILPQLSFAAQQERAIALAKQAEYLVQQEQERLLSEQRLQQIKQQILQEVGNRKLLLPQATIKVYQQNNFELLWRDPSAVKLFLKEYGVFAASGVSPKSAQALQQILQADQATLRDILLTDSFLDFLYYNKNAAKFANKWLYELGSYQVKTPDEMDIEIWLQAAEFGGAQQFIQSLIPQNHIYQQVVEKLMTMASDESVKGLGIAKSSKNKKKSNQPAQPEMVSVSFAKLALNAQRLRIIPSFDNGIFVNIPSYQLYYFRDGKLALQSKVIVGRDERRTPVMYSKLSNVVVNPPWNVPITIKNQDLVPKLRKDPNYAENHNYEILDGRGNKISAHSINWDLYNDPKKNFPYHIRQQAGDYSALGRYKFNMPSSDAIYLHDTPNKGLFGKTNRALSSGCVRVAKSDELATLLLKEAGWSAQRKQSVLESKKTTSAQIRSDNPVYLYYVTAWVENGQVYTLPDIYRFDTKLPKVSIDWEQLKNVM